MENRNNKPYQHLSLQDRYDIEEGLNRNYSFSRIADMLQRDRTTISKEVFKRRVGNSLRNSLPNDCLHKVQCPKQHLCTDCPLDRRCCTCRKIDCRSICTDYSSDACRYTTKSPFVCNGCSMVYDCSKPHFYYRANSAHNAYIDSLKNSREGIGLSRQELYELDCLITPLIKQGQSLSHIYCIHKDEIPCSLKTLYNYINLNILTVRNIDLPKKVKYKARKKKKPATETTFAYRENRTYKDLQDYISEHPYENVVELDTVHGSSKKGKVLLTMLFRSYNFMVIFLLDECTQLCVQKVFDLLEEGLGMEIFYHLFGIIITDNGPEFKNPHTLETSLTDGTLRTKIFFCDPLASWQKGKLEKNHEYIRKIIPKGISLTNYTTQDITLMTNHINSTVRCRVLRRGETTSLKYRQFSHFAAQAIMEDHHYTREENFIMKITYTQVGDYLLPDIFLSEKPPIDGFVEPLGKYARMRKAFLKEHRTIYYNTLLLSEQLFSHLRDVDIIANERKLRGVDEEIILSELVYE